MMKIFLPISALLFFGLMGRYYVLVVNTLFFLVMVWCPTLVSPNSVVGSVVLDRLNTPLIMLTLWITALMVVASEMVSLNSWGSFIRWTLGLCGALIMAFAASSFFGFYIFFEAALLPTWVLVLGWGYQPERVQAGAYLVLYTVGASLPLLISIFLLYMENSGLSFFFISWSLPVSYGVYGWWAMSVVAFMVKTPLYVFHLWLPKAHVEAPVAGSMILAGVLLKLGGFGMFRLVPLFQSVNKSFACALSALSLWGAVVSSMVCLRQTDMKALIAYSSITHMGVAFAGAMSNTIWGWQGALVVMLAHGLVSSALFALANMTYLLVQTRSLFLTKGVMSYVPVMSVMWFMVLSANMGVPPTINFQGEMMLVSGIVSISTIFVVPISVSLFLSAVYCLHLFSSSQHGSVSFSVAPYGGASCRSMVMIFLHIAPVCFFFFKTDLITCWVV